MSSSQALLFQILAVKLPCPISEYRFHDTRQWRFDYAWPEHLLAVEFEGGVYSRGRHTRGKGFEGDCEKYNTATLQGWRVLRFTARHVKNGTAVAMIEAFFETNLGGGD